VMLTASRAEQDLIDSLQAGAVGYLLLDTDPQRLPHALHGVMAGEAAVPRQLLVPVLDQLRSDGRRKRLAAPTRPAVDVTRREWEVLELMHAGLSTADVARRLVLSPVTVRRHLSAAVKKLGLGDRESALRLLDARV
jgi:DNA-binding NarL/FixJ family response regulator